MPLYPLPTSSSSGYNIQTKTANYPAVINEFVQCSSAAFTVTLPTAVGQGGKSIGVIKTDSTAANKISFATTSSQTIGGAAASTVFAMTLNEGFIFTSDNANWQITSHTFDASPQTFTSTFASSGGTPGVPGTNTQQSRWWRTKGGVRMLFHFEQTVAGTTGSSTFYTWTIPNSASWTITSDIKQITAFDNINLGRVYGSASGSTTNAVLAAGGVGFNSSTTFGISIQGWWGSGIGPFGGNANVFFTADVIIPITGFL